MGRHLRGQGGERGVQFQDLDLVGDAGLALFQLLIVFVYPAPLVHEDASVEVGAADDPVTNELKVFSQRRLAEQQVPVEDAAVIVLQQIARCRLRGRIPIRRDWPLGGTRALFHRYLTNHELTP